MRKDVQRRKDVIRGVAKALEKSVVAKECHIGFNLSTYYDNNKYSIFPIEDRTKHKCGTVACIAGWTVILYKKDGDLRKRPLRDSEVYKRYHVGAGNIMGDAMDIMGISFKEAEALFEPDSVDKTRVTPKDAAKVLRHFAKTGKIDWERVIKDDE
jgi:hypothetical protein